MTTEALRSLMREQLSLDKSLRVVLDELLEPTTTGYMHREQSWGIAWIKPGEYGVELEFAIDPPRGAYEWNFPTAERLQELQKKLGCDRIYAFALERGKVRYFASYNKETP